MSSPDRLYKFGKTSSKDVLERYSVEKHYRQGWRGVPLSEDYNVRVLWSTWVTPEEAIEAERWFKETYPKTFFVETDYNGITECRNWDNKQSYVFFDTLRKRYPERDIPFDACQKIYYVMLTKKQI